MCLDQQIEHHADLRRVEFLVRLVAVVFFPARVAASQPEVQIIHHEPSAWPQQPDGEQGGERVGDPFVSTVEVAEIDTGLAAPGGSLFLQDPHQGPAVSGRMHDGADIALHAGDLGQFRDVVLSIGSMIDGRDRAATDFLQRRRDYAGRCAVAGSEFQTILRPRRDDTLIDLAQRCFREQYHARVDGLLMIEEDAVDLLELHDAIPLR